LASDENLEQVGLCWNVGESLDNAGLVWSSNEQDASLSYSPITVVRKELF
jgi:hypothetical protein